MIVDVKLSGESMFPPEIWVDQIFLSTSRQIPINSIESTQTFLMKNKNTSRLNMVCLIAPRADKTARTIVKTMQHACLLNYVNRTAST